MSDLSTEHDCRADIFVRFTTKSSLKPLAFSQNPAKVAQNAEKRKSAEQLEASDSDNYNNLVIYQIWGKD